MRLCMFAVAVLLLSGLAWGEAGQQQSVLVTDVRTLGVPESAGAAITTRIAEIVSQRPGLSATVFADIQDALELEKTRRLMGCQEDAFCLANASRAVDTDLVLTGSVGKIGVSFVISLTLVDSKEASPVGRVSETVENLDKLPEVLPGVLARLFGWETAESAPRFKLAKGQKMSFAVFDLSASGVSKETAQNLTQILSVEIKRIEGAKVVSRDDIVAMLQLEKDKFLMGCADDTSCVAEVGGALGVDKLVVGSVGKLAESFVVSLRLIDPSAVKVDSRVTESYRGTEGQLIRAVRSAGRRLLGVAGDAKGAMAVSASEEEAEVYIDNRKAGQLPLPPIGELGAGRHLVRVTKSGYFDWLSEIYVDPEETTSVWAKLDEKPEKWYEKWWVWTIAGAVLVSATTVAILAGSSSDNPPPYGDIFPGDANVELVRSLMRW